MIHSVDGVDNPPNELKRVKKRKQYFLFELMSGVGE